MYSDCLNQSIGISNFLIVILIRIVLIILSNCYVYVIVVIQSDLVHASLQSKPFWMLKHNLWIYLLEQVQNVIKISLGAGLAVFHLIKSDVLSLIFHPWSRTEGTQALQSENFTSKMIDKYHVKHVAWDCRDIEIFFASSIPCLLD